MPCRGPDYYEEKPSSKALVTEIDKLTKMLCAISRNVDTSQRDFLINVVPGYKSFLENHQVLDEARWYEKYKSKYPKFTKEEIVKMVRNNILPE